MSKARPRRQPANSAVTQPASDAQSFGERQSQVTLQMRQSLHQELARRAFDSGMTMRGYIMRALQKSGLHVTEVDLIDRRRREY